MKAKLEELLSEMLNKQNNITSGTTSVTQTGAQTSHAITFGKTFPSAPTVVVTAENTDGIPYSVWIVSVSTTGAMVNAYWSGHTVARSLKLHWIAISNN